MRVCRKCGHLAPEGLERHLCPDQDYIEARGRLIAEAAQGDPGEAEEATLDQ